MYDLCDKLLNGVKSIYVNILPWVSVKEEESESFGTNSGMRRGYTIYP